MERQSQKARFAGLCAVFLASAAVGALVIYVPVLLGKVHRIQKLSTESLASFKQLEVSSGTVPVDFRPSEDDVGRDSTS